MCQNLRLLLVCAALALGLCVPGVVWAEDVPKAPGNQLTLPVLAAESLPQADSCSPQEVTGLEEEVLNLEELKQPGQPVNVCNVPCGSSRPWVNCTQVCGDAAACFDGHCLYL
jgi:hypothetical protein